MEIENQKSAASAQAQEEPVDEVRSGDEVDVGGPDPGHPDDDYFEETAEEYECPEEEPEYVNMAKAGNFEGVWRHIRRTLVANQSFGGMDQSPHPPEHMYGCLFQAMEVACEVAPGKFIDRMYRQMIALTGTCIAHTHLHVTELLHDQDRMRNTTRAADFCRDMIETVIPRLMELQNHYCDLTHTYASTARLWHLAHRGGRLDGGASNLSMSPPITVHDELIPAKEGVKGSNGKLQKPPDHFANAVGQDQRTNGA